jgi:hypothetical protein
MADDTYAAYLAHRATGLAIPSGTYNSGLKVLWGDKVRSMSANNINPISIADIMNGTGLAGTSLADREMVWLTTRGAPGATSIADKRMYLVANALMP